MKSFGCQKDFKVDKKKFRKYYRDFVKQDIKKGKDLFCIGDLIWKF